MRRLGIRKVLDRYQQDYGTLFDRQLIQGAQRVPPLKIAFLIAMDAHGCFMRLVHRFAGRARLSAAELVDEHVVHNGE